MQKKFLWLVWLLMGTPAIAQQQPFAYRPYAHSHNDYEQAQPFEKAYSLGFGSIEADVYVQNGELMVAHTREEIRPERTFKSLYLNPLLQKIRANKGYPYPQKHSLQLLVDLKDAEAIQLLEQQLRPYQNELKHVQLVLSGSTPPYQSFSTQSSILSFDGRTGIAYTPEARKRIPLISSDVTAFGKRWDGKTPLPEDTAHKIKAFVEEVHRNGQKARLWGTPNSPLAYETLHTLGLDYIGSDDLDSLVKTLK